MNQINLKIESTMDAILLYLAQKSKLTKSAYAKELLIESLQEKILPILLKDYEDGKIGIRKIINLTQISAEDLLEQIRIRKIKCPLTQEIDEYSDKNLNLLIQNLNLEHEEL